MSHLSGASHLDGMGVFDLPSILNTVSPAVQQGVSTAASGAVQAAVTGGNSQDYENALRAGGAAAVDTLLPTMSQVPTGAGAQNIPIANQPQAMPIVNPNNAPMPAPSQGLNKTLLTVGLLAAAGVGVWWFMKRRRTS